MTERDLKVIAGILKKAFNSACDSHDPSALGAVNDIREELAEYLDGGAILRERALPRWQKKS